ncbi:unnamed protein product [Aphis gossypii]|uniref:DUF4806 domain-containing protein n=2 Tax=Aphis gossypii TaxID=80765 RepID=A0A9P0ITM3_APHGO|nr:unnamed protein product [Aphis gossypii]
MWTIVCFIEEDCVEIVPAFWFKNGLCAWPKKNVKKNVNQRTNPNDIEFNYYKARALSKDIESLQVARSRLIRAEETSELSSYDFDKSTRRKRHQKHISSDDESECDYQMKSLNSKTKKKNDSKYRNSSQFVLKDPPVFQNNDVDINHKKTIEDDNYDKDNIPSSQQAYNITNETSDNTHSNIFDSCNSVLISPSGKWKVTTVNNEETDFISSRKKLDFDHTPFTTNDLKKDTLYSSTPSLKKCFSITGNASKPHQTYDDNNTKVSVQLSQSTLLSPLKTPSTNLGLKYKTDQNSNKTKKQHQESNQIAGLIDTVHQLIRTTSNLRFEIRELAKKMDTMDQRLNDTIVNTSSAVHENNDLSDESSWDLPLTTIENLELFEEKLSDKLFRKKVINELSRYERSTIAETTRQITSKIFHNNLLSQFSYHGQKHKRVFSVLNSCSLIFSKN